MSRTIIVNVTQAKARLGELLDRVESGENVIVTRRGRTVARIVFVWRRRLPLPLEELAAFRATMPRLRKSSARLLREARDEEL